jgi:hypothetical protein
MTETLALDTDDIQVEPARPARGWKRMRQIRAADEAERKALADQLAAGVGRPVTAIDQVAITAIAATTVRADRLRLIGKSDLEERRLLAQLLRTSGIRPAPPAAPKADPMADLQSYLAGFADQDGADEEDAEAEENA